MYKQIKGFVRLRALGHLLAGTAVAVMLAAAPTHAQSVTTTTDDASVAPVDDVDTTPLPAASTATPNSATLPALTGTADVAADENSDIYLKAGRENLRTGSIDGLRPARYVDDPPGIRVGTMIFRPALTQGVGVERTVSGGSASTRSYSQTTFDGDLISDWSRHELRITGSGTWQKNISGTGETKPTANINAKLRLDVTRDTTLNFTGGYNFARESSTDPNSISGASVQSGVHSLSSGLEAIHDFGAIRGTVGATVTRSIYGPATLSDGSQLTMSDRNATTADLRLRIGYEISPVLMPFAEVNGGKMFYDKTVDSNGYARNARYLAAKAGLAYDFGDKLRGELSGGYKTVSYTDSRLASIRAFTIDGNTTWSPQRGTDVTLGVSTTVDPSTSANVSGSTAYALTAAISQQMLDYLVARLDGSTTFRHYGSGNALSDQIEWVANAGLSWSLTRYVDLTGDVGVDYTNVRNGTDTTVWKSMVGIKFKR
jgi:hypothetical protein